MKLILLLFFVHSLHAQFLPNGCPADYHIHLLLRDEDDCGKYYSCSNGYAISMPCPENTLFDESLQVCNWAYEVKCDKPVSSTTVSTTDEVPSTTVPTTTEVPSTTVPATTEVPSTAIPSTTVVSTTNTDLTDSTTEFTTPQPTYPTSEQTSTTEEQTTVTETQTSTEQPTTTPETTTIINLTPEDCTSEFDNNLGEDDCDKYFSCEEGAKLVLSCRSAKLFNFNLNVNYNKVF